MPINIQDLLPEVSEFLSESNFTLPTSHEDGRVNSSLGEDTVIELLISEYGDLIESAPKARHWYDLKICGMPVNIKITTGKGADNVSSKKGLYYALTGKDPSGVSDSWETFLNELKNNIKTTEKDYYFLVINKTDPSKVTHTSIKKIKNLTANANNLPFQKKWKFEGEDESESESGPEYIIKMLKESICRLDLNTLIKKNFPSDSEIKEYKQTKKILLDAGCFDAVVESCPVISGQMEILSELEESTQESNEKKSQQKTRLKATNKGI